MQTKFRHKYVFPVFFLLIFASCGNAEPETDWITTTLCQPPCWQNITPGKTTVVEISELLTSNPYVVASSIYYQGPIGGVFSEHIIFDIGILKLRGQIYFVDDKVSMMSFYDVVDNQVGRTIEISIDTLIDLYGEPTSLLESRSFGPGGGLLGDAIHKHYYLLYPADGIAFSYDSFYLKEQDQSKVFPEIEANKIIYFYPEDFSLLMDEGYFYSGVFMEGFDPAEEIQEWEGYGEYPRQQSD